MRDRLRAVECPAEIIDQLGGIIQVLGGVMAAGLKKM